MPYRIPKTAQCTTTHTTHGRALTVAICVAAIQCPAVGIGTRSQVATPGVPAKTTKLMVG